MHGLFEWGIAFLIGIPIAAFVIFSASSEERDEIKTGPRGGRYRVTDKGRKSYDVE